MLSKEEFLLIYNEGPDATYAFVKSLLEAIESLTRRVEALESQLKKNSSNSSKPPSSDGFNKPSRTKSLREKSGKKPGGQIGHKGTTLKQADKPDKIKRLPVIKCTACNFDLASREKISVEKRQVIDIPPITTQVIEFQADVKDCPCCGSRNIGEFPSWAKESIQYGPRVKALSAYFMNYQFLPYKRLQECFQDVFNCNISTGSLYNFQNEAYCLLEEPEQQVITDLKSSPILHADESGFYVNGKRRWIHEYSSETSTFYAHHEKRGVKAMLDIGILTDYKGRCIHDHWDSYFLFDCLHGLCNSHHLRELKFLHEVKKEDWADKMKKCLLSIKSSVSYYKDKNRLPKKLITSFTNRYRRIIKLGLVYQATLPSLEKKGVRGRKAQHPGKNMLDRLKGKEENVLAFMNDFTVPFDNNLGERDIRMTKVKQKISGCYRSSKGGDFFCRIRGIISTIRKRNLNTFESLYGTFVGINPI